MNKDSGIIFVMEHARILVIDNYDSFVYTIVGYLQTLGAQTTVVRNDAFYAEKYDLSDFDGVLISPGPGNPDESGCSREVLQMCLEIKKPVMGVCLGLQVIGDLTGGSIIKAPVIRHGKTSMIKHDGKGVFEGISSPVEVTRYHSLVIDPETVPDCLEVSATACDDGTIQAVRHKTLPAEAVQFHPESVMTKDGYRLFANWLVSCGQTNAVEAAEGLKPKVAPAEE